MSALRIVYPTDFRMACLPEVSSQAIAQESVTSFLEEKNDSSEGWHALAIVVGIFAAGFMLAYCLYDHPTESLTNDLFSEDNFHKNKISREHRTIKNLPANQYAILSMTSTSEEKHFIAANDNGKLKCSTLAYQTQLGILESYLKEKKFKLYQPQ